MYGYVGLKATAGAPYGSLPPLAKPPPSKKKHLNFYAVLLCWLIPCATFCIVTGLLSSTFRTSQPLLANVTLAIVMLFAMAAVYVATLMVIRWIKGQFPEFPFWYAFMGACTLVALITGAWFAELNYGANVYASENLDQLAFAKSVDPAVDSSTRYMDAGRLQFVKGASLDLEKYIGFKNNDVYCVAPIVNGEVADKNLRSASEITYDYWAVGLNCCSAGGFKCGEFNNPDARSGVRLLREDQRSFYALAVQEAQATFGLKVQHPLFFFWTEDSKALQTSWQAAALQYWLLACLTFAGFQTAAVIAAIVAFVKIYL